jgi:hypothetical protein
MCILKKLDNNRVGGNINPNLNTPLKNSCLMHIGHKNNIKYLSESIDWNDLFDY